MPVTIRESSATIGVYVVLIVVRAAVFGFRFEAIFLNIGLKRMFIII